MTGLFDYRRSEDMIIALDFIIDLDFLVWFFYTSKPRTTDFSTGSGFVFLIGGNFAFTIPALYFVYTASFLERRYTQY